MQKSMKNKWLYHRKTIIETSTIHEKHTHIVKFIICTKAFHQLSVIGRRITLPLHRNQKDVRTPLGC